MRGSRPLDARAAWGIFEKMLVPTTEMRDPRSGFATGICHHAATNEAPLAIGVLGLLLCCACGGATTASLPERSPRSPVTVEQSAPPAPAAQRAPRVVGLRYGAPPECPDVERYASHVRSRSANLSIQPAADALVSADVVSVQVQPAPDASGWLGRVSITGPLALDREVRGARCEDVVAALALITVLRLEGADASALAGSSVAGTTSPTNAGSGTTGATAGATAREGAPSLAATPVAAAPSAPSREAAVNADAASTRANAEPSGTAAATTSEPASELTPDAPASEPSASTTPTPDPSSAELEREAADDGRASIADGAPGAVSDGSEAARAGAPAASAPAAASRTTDFEADTTSVDSSQAASAPSWRWPSVSAAAVALRAGYATVPGHAFQAALEGELRLGEGWVSELSLAYARGKDEVDLAKLDLSLLTLDVGLCPLELGTEAPVWLRACAGLRAGALHLEISPTQGGLSEASVWRPWASLTPSLRFGVPLSARWTLRGLAELAVQLVRDNFDVELTAVDGAEARRFTVYRPEAISLELGLGVGYSF
jgi:hypothetical protein